MIERIFSRPGTFGIAACQGMLKTPFCAAVQCTDSGVSWRYTLTFQIILHVMQSVKNMVKIILRL